MRRTESHLSPQGQQRMSHPPRELVLVAAATSRVDVPVRFERRADLRIKDENAGRALLNPFPQGREVAERACDNAACTDAPGNPG